jgi:hypothetical protein
MVGDFVQVALPCCVHPRRAFLTEFSSILLVVRGPVAKESGMRPGQELG